MRPELVYVAGPFFNPVQISILEEVEEVLNRSSVPMYLPRIDGGVLDMSGDKASTHESAKECYNHDIEALHKCDYMIAVLPYALDGEMLATGTVEFDGFRKKFVANNWGLVLPDTGTVWEIGYFTALQKPVVGYYPIGLTKLNIMLCQSMRGVITGTHSLKKWVERGWLDQELDKWEGDME
jgi:nucleoside deoxyribosyltransferase